MHFETADNVVVGQVRPKQFAVLDSDNVVSLIKRRMGETHDMDYHGTVQTPESISAFILLSLAADASKYTNGPVERAVITSPCLLRC